MGGKPRAPAGKMTELQQGVCGYLFLILARWKPVYSNICNHLTLQYYAASKKLMNEKAIRVVGLIT